MGVIGKRLGEALGKSLGHFMGSKLGKYTGIHAKEGGRRGMEIAGGIGNLLPFKKGGRVRRNGKIIAHKGEFILPRGVKPTKKQIQKVRKRGGRL